MDIYKHLGERIRLLRTENGLTQARLADIINSSAEFISRIERGKSAPSIATAARIAEGLGVNIQSLFDFGGLKEVDLDGARARRIAHVILQADEGVGGVLEELVVQAARRLRCKEI